MRATTPIRFLQRLNLLPEEEEQPIEMRLWDTLDDWLGDQAAETDAHALADLPASEALETYEAPRIGDPIARAERRDVPPSRDAVRERPRLPFRRAITPAGMRPAVRIPAAPVTPPARQRQPSPELRAEGRAEDQAPPALPVIPIAPPRETPSREVAPVADSQPQPASLRVESIVPAPADVVRRSIAETPATPVSRAPIEPPGVDSTETPAQTWTPAPRHIAAAPVVSERVSSPAAPAPDRVVAVPAAPQSDIPSTPIARQDPARPVDVPSTPQAARPTSRDRDEVILAQGEEPFADLASAITDVVEAAARVREAIPQPPPPVARPIRRARVEELPVERPPVPDAERPAVVDAESAESEGPVYRSPAPRGRPLQRRPAPAPEPPRDREGDRLFQPAEDGIDRSPAAWAARLAESMRPASRTTRAPLRAAAGPERGTPTPTRAAHTPAAPRATQRPRPAASPVQLSQATRRFLKPLVGIDPASVTILQGPLPSAVTSAHRADALAIGDDTILVGSAFVGEMPRDLGLLAHELTHIARERRPRFIPPAARASRSTSTAEPSEESLARRVESRVVHLARSGPAHSDAGRPGAAVSEALLSDPSPEPSIPEAADAGTMTATPRVDAEWGGLPAPWEPLPEWLAPGAPGRGQATATFSPRASHATSGAVAAAPVSMAAPARVSVQRAEEGRELDAPEQSSPAAPAEAPAGVAPDLDLLARQVYAVLKRRLESETRREQMF